MTSSIVVPDASAIVALLIEAGDASIWVGRSLRGARLVAPSLMPFEVANVLRRHELAGIIDTSYASLALTALTRHPVDLWPLESVAARAWSLRHTVTFYDATYIALAEQVGAPLVTLDRRLAQAPGPRCEFIVFEQS